MKPRKGSIAIDPRTAAKRRLARETGYVVKNRGGKASIALVYPNSYEIAMSNLGYQKIYRMLNDRADILCERAFLPSGQEIDYFKKHNQKPATLESGRALAEFDVIAFSITFEHDYLNALKILNLAGIPLKDRDGRAPLVMAGGVAVTMNPEVMAPFLDFMVIGEGEGIIEPFCDLLIKGERDLSAFAAISGIYVPAGYEPVYKDDGTIEKFAVKEGFPQKVKRAWNHSSTARPNINYIDTPDTVFGDMSLIEIGKGCGKHCRFCAAGYIYRPTRNGNTNLIMTAIDKGIERKGKVGLVGSAIGDHPDVEKIFERIVKGGGEFSVSSLRLDKLSDTMIDLLLKGNCHTITVAPEAGTEALRARINKKMSDELILDTARRIAGAWPFKIKMYFIVGLPGETMKDVEGIVDLVKRVRGVMEPEWKRHGRAGEITVGVDGFVPKALTPFQWEPFEGIKPVAKKLFAVADGLRKTPNVTVQKGSARQAYAQALLSQGDRRLASLIELCMELDGDWSRALRETDLNTDHYATRRKGLDEVLPWSIIDDGLRKNYLSQELSLSGKGKVTPECPPPEKECHRCGVFVGACVKVGGR